MAAFVVLGFALAFLLAPALGAMIHPQPLPPLRGLRGLRLRSSALKERLLQKLIGPDEAGAAARGPDASAATPASAPVVLTEEICLVPGEPVVRVEVAPGNARRIFTGIDIVSDSCPDVHELVWKVLTDYESLTDAVPNLVSNKVIARVEGDELGVGRGARLEQVGAAKLSPLVPEFKASTTLDVREYPEGLPRSMEADHLPRGDQGTQADAALNSHEANAMSQRLPLTRDVFPRPYSLSSVPRRDITMQGVEGLGDFAFYQGVWRMQELPGCAPTGAASAMRLTYSVELSPRAWVPVKLLEGQIASTLAENLESVRDFVTKEENVARCASPHTPGHSLAYSLASTPAPHTPTTKCTPYHSSLHLLC